MSALAHRRLLTGDKEMSAVKEVVLYSSHTTRIAGFQAVLQRSPEYTLSVCRDADLLHEHAPDADVFLADVTCGITLTRLSELRTLAPATPMILWTGAVSTEFVSQALGLGVLGVLPRSAGVELCLRCLRQVAAGQIWINDELSQRLLRTRTLQLAPREWQVIGMLAQGFNNREIGDRLGIAEVTVRVHLSRLYDRVEVSDRFELAHVVLKNLASDRMAC
jgi:DNA-binding NarL/FixJ family response regulator